jgi:hypothetical protein
MTLTNRLGVPGLLGIPGLVDRWAVGSQQTARRNAMIASTALTQRRAELDEVEEFLASLGEAPAHVPTAAAVAHG